MRIVVIRYNQMKLIFLWLSRWKLFLKRFDLNQTVIVCIVSIYLILEILLNTIINVRDVMFLRKKFDLIRYFLLKWDDENDFIRNSVQCICIYFDIFCYLLLVKILVTFLYSSRLTTTVFIRHSLLVVEVYNSRKKIYGDICTVLSSLKRKDGSFLHSLLKRSEGNIHLPRISTNVRYTYIWTTRSFMHYILYYKHVTRLIQRST